jgi:C4-dicarboxylate-specific signal transduction histidine kinase
MKHSWLHQLWRSAALCVLGTIGIGLLTFVCFRLHVALLIVAILYLVVVLTLSVSGGFLPSIFTSVIAVLALDYFFTQPLFSLGMTDPLDVITLVSFLAIASITSLLMLQRRRFEAVLRESEQRHRADQAEQALREAQVELAHVTRVTTLGEMTASIAHEINQPLAGVVTNGQAGLRWLGQDPPRLDEVRSALERIVRDGKRASEMIGRIRATAKKADPQKHAIDINDVINEGVVLVRSEVQSRGVSLRTECAPALPRVLGDRVQLQQVIINLMMNGVEAMERITDRPREILIRSRRQEADGVLVQVRDSGGGIDAANVERLFKAFYSTKPSGMGMGLSICRSIITAHGGRLWASPNEDHGATFQFTLPISENGAP